MRYWKLLLCAALTLVFSLAAHAAAPIKTYSPTEAAQAVGHHATICGVVANVRFAINSPGSPTFINLGQPYPNEPFHIFIRGDDRPGFSPAPESWQGKEICVTGNVRLYKGIPEIIARSSGQIRVLSK
ncbi:MAG TPA: hypothetical protein VFW94_03415 [Candidatus Acidoferrales bacterium]|nr:hypothetical protein [Candidatus Acidoferrales bacterium]